MLNNGGTEGFSIKLTVPDGEINRLFFMLFSEQYFLPDTDSWELPVEQVFEESIIEHVWPIRQY